MLRGQALLSSLHGVRSISILRLLADCDGASIGGQSPVGLWTAVFVVEVLAVGGWDCLRIHSVCDISFIVKDFYQQKVCGSMGSIIAFLKDQSYHFRMDTGEVCWCCPFY